MARPRKYATDAEAKAAKLEKQRERRNAKHALKFDPTKRKDAKVNVRAYPYAPVDDGTMAVIRQIMREAGYVYGVTTPSSITHQFRAAAMMQEWEDTHKMRLPALEEEIMNCGVMENGIQLTQRNGEGYEWNRLRGTLRFLAHHMERSNKSKRKNERRAEKERAEADAAGLTVAELRNRKDTFAKLQWQSKTQAAYLWQRGEQALAKRNARIQREEAERMTEQKVFGRF